jgi:hypothetical protein
VAASGDTGINCGRVMKVSVRKVAMPQESPQLEPSELQRQIMTSLASYANRSAFECFALLMGKAQILEFGLKTLLARSCLIDHSEMEKWTLGTVASALDSNGFRPDYVALLKEFVKDRNYIAHEMLVNNAIFRSMAANVSERFEFKQLQQPAFDLERLLILHDWCEEHDAWGLSR